MLRNRVRSRSRAIGLFSDAALNINFVPISGASPSLDSRITFTRSSTATYINSAGVISNAAINEPRFDYDPTTLSLKGLLIEGQRTNLLLQSAALSTQSVTVSATSYTLSFYGTGTITLSGAFSGALNGSGAFPTRSTLTFTPTSGTLTLTVTGTVQNAQLEVGAFPTSYIPTTTTASTRSADIASMTGTNFSSWYNQVEGTLYLQAQCISAVTSQTYLGIDNNSANNFICVRTSPSSTTFDRAQVTDGGVTQAALGASGYVATAINKYAFAYKTNDFARSINNSAISADASGTIPDVNQMFIGSERGSSILNGHILRISYYPSRLSNEKLKAITS